MCVLGLQVAVEGKGCMVLVTDNYDFTGAIDVLQGAVIQRPINA